MYFFYKGWEVSDLYKTKSLNERQMNILDACIYYSEEGSTIRDAAPKFGLSSTSFWRGIHNECKEISPELYEEVKKQIKRNLRKVGR